MADSVAARGRGATTQSRVRRNEMIAGMLFALPAVLGVIVFQLGPLLVSLGLSFTNYDILSKTSFTWLENYQRMVDDPLFLKSALNTLFVTALGVPTQMIVALSLAMLLSAETKAMSLFRTLYYLPAITPTVAAAILWRWILQSQWGLLNAALRVVGIQGPLWLGSPDWSKPAIVLMNAWSSGSMMLIFLAGLKGIPDQLYEAAEIDGANWWHKFFRITIPMLTPTIFFLLVLSIISHLRIFTEAFVLTQGGPLDSTLFYVYYLFNNAFVYFRMGYAAAMAWVLFIVIMLLTLLQFKLANRWVYYEAAEAR
ncbi:MAG: carbohydrate ABC transporter permease [Anaerolineae bacterium]